MKSQMSYKAKRNAIIVLIVAIIAILASVGFYFFMNSNDETQAVSQTNGTSADRAGEEVEQAQADNNEQNNDEQDNNEENTENNENVDETTDNNNENNNTNNNDNNTANNNLNDNNNNDNDNNEPQTTTQTVTTTEEVERTETLVGFRTASLNYDISGVSAIIPDREPPTVEIKAERRTDNGREEVTGDLTNSGSIYFTFTWSEPVEGFTRDDIRYEGFDHPESTTLTEIEPGRVYEFIVYAQNDAEVETTMTVLANSVTDLYGNENEEDTVKTITIDRKAPEYINMGIFNRTNYIEGTETEATKYATNGSHIRLFVSFPEMLAVNPKVDIYGNDGKVTTLDLVYSEAAKFYYVEFDISDEMNLPEEKIKYTVYGYADEAGNVGVELTEEMTLSTQYPYVIYDVTPPETGIDGFPLYILSLTDNDHRQYIKDGVTLRVEANFNEPLDPNTLPVLTIGTDGKTQTVEFKNKGTLGKKYVYVADIKIDNSILQLNEGDRIEFTVTNVKDLAGNIAEFNNDNVTQYYKNDKLIYNQVTYDATAPEYYSLEILNNSHYKEYRENGDISVLQYATYGDNIKLLISFNEKLAVPPTLEIGGKTFTMNYSDQTSESMGRAYYDRTLKIGDGENEITLDEGLVEFKVYGFEDAAGNTIDEALTEADVQNTDYIKVIYDVTPPTRRSADFYVNGKQSVIVEEDGEEEQYQFAKNGDTIVMNAKFYEELADIPTFFLVDSEGNEINLNENGTVVYRGYEEKDQIYLYQASYTIPEDESELPEGEMTIKITNIIDKAGLGEGYTITEPSNGRRVVYDRTAPGTGEDGFPLFILNYRLDDTRPYTVVKDGEKLFVEANFTEKLAHNPQISLIRKDGTKTDAIEIPYVDMIGERYRYYVVLPFDAADLQLENGDRIDFEITDVEDYAGNTTTFNNDNVTSMKLDDGREYGQVYYDNKAPEYYSLEILNITHYEENKNIENEEDKEDLKVATTGDRIRVLISFNEELAVEPQLRINGIECGTIPYSVPTSTSMERPYYLVDFTIAEETDINKHKIKLDEGKVQIEVYGYEDVAGNTISEPLTNDDIKNTNYTEVTYDVTPPVHYSLGIFNNTHYNENYDIENEEQKKDVKYATTGDTIRILISFEEKLSVEPKLKVGDKVISWGLPFSPDTTAASGGNYYYLTDIDISDDMNLVDGAPIPITIYDYEDAAGVKGETITNIGEESGIKNTEFTEVIYDVTPPEILREGKTLEDNSYVNRTFYPVFEDAGIDYATIIRPGKTEPENYPIDEENKGQEISHDGTYTITVYDKVGLSTTRTFTMDQTDPQITKVHIYNKENGSQYIKDGDTIRVDATLSEELGTPPTLTIGNQTVNNFKRINSGNGEIIYQANLTLNEDNELDQGAIKFIISGYKDLAGNDGEEVTKASEDAIYDSISPDENVYRVRIQVQGKGVAGEPAYATVNDWVWLYVTFKEPLSVEPKFIIAGEQAEICQRVFENKYTYAAKVQLAGTMKEGLVEFSVSDYKDLAGNEGKTLDSIVNDNSSVTFDKTAPSATVSYSHDKDNPTNGKVTVKIKPEETIKDIDGWTKNSDGTYSKEYDENEQEVVTIEDLVGLQSIIKIEVNGIDREAPVITLLEDNTFEVGVDTYTYPEEGTVVDDFDGNISFSKVHMKWYKATTDGKKGEEVKPFEWGTKLEGRELGDYYIEYWVYDKAGNKGTASRVVTLQDNTAPVITVNEEDTFEIGVDTYTYPEDITVTDNRDGNMPAENVNIIWYYATPEGGKGEVAYSENFPWNTKMENIEPGTTYYIEYWIEDEEGNRGEAHKLLTFADNTAPEIKLNGDKEIHFDTVEDAAGYMDAGATVTDNSDENIEIQVQINWFEIVGDEQSEYNVSGVGVKGEGRYNIVYTAKDASGNRTEVQRLVYIGM